MDRLHHTAALMTRASAALLATSAAARVAPAEGDRAPVFSTTAWQAGQPQPDILRTALAKGVSRPADVQRGLAMVRALRMAAKP